MHDRRRLWTWLWLGCMIPALAGLVWGQAPKGKAAPAPGGAAAKSKAPARAAESADSGEWELPPVPAADDPAVHAILQTKPTSPKELVRAGKVLAGLGRADLARGFFKQVLDAGLDQQQLVALAEELGPETFVQIVGRPELAPEGRTLAGAVLGAATRQAQDPARIAAWIQKLQDPSADVRYQAQVELQKAHGAAAGPLVAVLADPARAAEHARVRAALVRLGQDAVRPLLGIMDASETKTAVAAIRVLGDFDDRQIHGYLLGPSARTDVSAEIRQAAQGALLKRVGSVPSSDQARRLLADLARRCFDRKQPLELDPAGQVTTWSWDAAKQQAVAAGYSVEEASRRLAIRFARDACLVAPGDKELLTLYLAAMLEQAAWQNGLDRPMPVEEGTVGGQIAGFEPEAIERIVALGMTGDHAPSAAAAAQILGQKEGAARLLVRSGQPSPLALATRHADRRLRLAAAEAIVRMRPAGSFAGSSWVLEGLDFLAASDGSRRALVAGPRREDRQRVAGLIANLGYEADTAATGGELLAKATAAPDCELILVDASIDRPTLDFLVQQIRRDGRTAALPVGILARPEVLERARHVAAKDSRSEAFSYAFEAADARWQVERLVALAPDLVPAPQRHRHAVRALELMGDLAGGPGRGTYDLRRVENSVLVALNGPETSSRAAAVLGQLGTPACQRALVELASRTSAPLPARQASVAAFREAVQRCGLLLTTPEIQRQYDRYNQSAHEDPTTQKVLGLILDCIEAPTQTPKQAARDTAEQEPRMASHGALR